MPRAADLYPSKRGLNDVHSPVRGLLDYTSPMDAVAREAGDMIRQKIEDVVTWIKNTTGIDLTGFTELLTGFESVTGINLFELADLNLFDNIPDLINALQGIDWRSGPGAIKDFIEAVAAAIPIIGPILSALIGFAIPDDIDDPLDLIPFVGRFGDNLRAMFPGVNFNSVTFNPQAALANLVNIGLLPLNLLLGRTSPLNALHLFGSIFPSLLGLVPVSSIAEFSENLVPDPTFSDAEAIDEVAGWSHDATVGRTTAGSARVDCDGTLHELLSDPATPVAPGQKMAIEIYVRKQDVEGGTLPIQLGIATYNEAGAYMSLVPIAAQGIGTSIGFDKLSGTYVVPPGVRFVRHRLAVTASATGGRVWFDDANHHKTQKLAIEYIQDLPVMLADLLARIREILNKAWNAVFSDDDGIIDRTADDLAYALRNIPGINVIAKGGANVVDTITDMLDAFWRGLSRKPGSGKSAADVANAAKEAAEMADTAVQIGEWNNAVMGLRNNKSLMEGVDETEEANYNISELFNNTAEPPSVMCNAETSPVSFWRATESAMKGFVSWFGKGFTNVTTLHLDIYRLNYVTEKIDLLYTSPNLIGSVVASYSYVIHYLPQADRIQVNAGDVLAIAWRSTGTGTHTIAGKTATWLPTHPTVVPGRPAASFTPGGPFDGMEFDELDNYYSGAVPWFGIGIADGDIPPPYFAPRTTTLDTPGPVTYEIPTWATHVDVVGTGGGGGGHGGNPVNGGMGGGGAAGLWFGETLVRGIDFPTEATELHLVVGDNGGYGPWNSAGSDGGATIRQAIPGGKEAVTGAGGAKGLPLSAGGVHGKDPGDFVYLGQTYAGGTGGRAGNARNGGSGTAPGAGGAGGAGGTFGVAWVGGSGGDGRAWITARQG